MPLVYPKNGNDKISDVEKLRQVEEINIYKSAESNYLIGEKLTEPKTYFKRGHKSTPAELKLNECTIQKQPTTLISAELETSCCPAVSVISQLTVSNKQNPPTEYNQCDKCDRVFISLASLYEHKYRHCKICNFLSSTLVELKKHSRLCHRKKHKSWNNEAQFKN